MAIQQRASGLFARAQSLIDSAISPSTRQQYYNNINAFAHESPLLFTFLLTQLVLSFTPLALFLSFVLGLLLLSFITALLFSLFWIGVALLVLVPTLFITVSLGIVVWIWGVGSFAVARWVLRFVPVGGRGKEVVSVNGSGGVKRENSNGA